MHGYYSRDVVLRLLERKSKSVAVAALQQCIQYNEFCEHFTNDALEQRWYFYNSAQLLFYVVFLGFILLHHSIVFVPS